jgi:serine/threonine-protein kinase
MLLDPRIPDLLLAWEEAHGRGQDLSAAHLCAECPELTPILEMQINALRQLSPVLNLTPFAEDAASEIAADEMPMPSEESLPGYQLLHEVGRGGAGVVCKARQLALNRVVAIKMVVAGQYAGEAALGRFRAEARTLAQLHHPHIVQIHDIGAFQGLPYFILEYLDGGNLAELVREQPLEPVEAAELVEMIARTVHQVHRAGIVHRDLKPANVLLQCIGDADHPPGAVQLRGQWFVPKLTDFGLARNVDHESLMPGSGRVVGTPAYMAPEQAQPGTARIGAATDIYGLGVILYQLLTATLPFQADTAWDTIQLIATADPAPPSGRRLGCPTELDAICLRCLRKRPEQRYATAKELADDLHSFLMHARGKGIGALGWWILVGAVVFALVVGVATLIWFLYSR